MRDKDVINPYYIKGNNDKNFCKKEYMEDGTIWLCTKDCRIEMLSLLYQVIKDWPVLKSRRFRKIRRQLALNGALSQKKKDV